MYIISARLFKSLIITLLLLSFHTLFASDWPIKKEIDLSSGFGDFRANRFHTGIDIRTGGKVGTPIYAPVSGYILRVRTAYTGYGKGLYLQGNDGFIYVFGHLLDFEPKIDSLIKTNQRAAKRYFQDITLPKNQFKIKKGDFLGYTGQTGTGAPHLHFEKRTTDNFPLNPLKNGFSLNDKIKPVFSKIGFKMLDNYALFDNGRRELEFIPQFDSVTQNYYLDTLLYFNNPFGLFAGVSDRMKKGGMQQSIYKLILKIDNKEFYSVTFDQLDFETQRAVNFRYEYLQAVNNEKRIQRLYNAEGNDFAGSKSQNKSEGIIGYNKNTTYGHHNAEIIAEDCFGNKRSLLFDFIFGPQEELFKLDSEIVKLKKEHYFYFTPIKDIEAMQIDSIVPFMNRADKWGKVKDAEIKTLKNGQIQCKLIGYKTNITTVRLFVFSKNAVIRDNIFSGILPKGKLSVTLNYEILEDGLLLNLDVKAKQSADARIELYYKDKLLDVVYPKLFNMNKYSCFIPPLDKYEHIDKIGYAMSKDTSYPLQYRDSLKINIVGRKNNQKITVQGLTFEFQKDDFYKPHFIQIDKRFYLKNSKERLVSTLVEIKPKAFICKSNFTISYDVRKTNPFYERTGLCWFDEDRGKWVWLENERDDHTLKAQSTGGGTFAVLYDLVPPEISRINIINGKTYTNRNMKVTFLVEDLLSGIADDQSFNVKLDKEWLIPEYDPESKRFIARPAKPLKPGKHHLGIEVVDRVGNKSEQYLNFFVKKSKSRR